MLFKSIIHHLFYSNQFQVLQPLGPVPNFDELIQLEAEQPMAVAGPGPSTLAGRQLRSGLTYYISTYTLNPI